MNEGTANTSKGQVIDTGDCLEAVSVFRGWKNFFFLIVAACLMLIQASFWAVDMRLVSVPPDRVNASDELSLAPGAPGSTAADANSTSTSKAGKTQPLTAGMLGWLSFDLLTRIVELVNVILAITSVLYCMAMFFSLMVSLIGRLGGINHISRAFFLSLIMLVLVLPWQKILQMNVPGVIYAPAELVTWFSAKSGGLLNTLLYYLRFVGYWLVVALLLILAQMRSSRWTMAILRRLEII